MKKAAVYDFLETPGENLHSGRWFRYALLTLIALNVLAVILQSVATINDQLADAFFVFELFSVAVFGIEYIVRMWAINAKGRFAGRWGRLRYVVSPLALIDLIAILPSLFLLGGLDLRFLRAARFLRLLRVLKAGRYCRTLQRFGSVAMETRSEMLLSFIIMLLLLVIGSGLMYSAENAAQPDVFSSIPAAMWWAVTTVTTVGYGDAYPVTALGKLIASGVAIIGIGMFALPSGILCAAFLERIRKERKGSCACPHCGKDID